MSNISECISHSQELRNKLLSDDYRPGYHFAVPGDYGVPGDPNGAFYAGGRYHLMYLYRCREDGYRYGHISSIDLLHWRWHGDAVTPDELDGGIFSGGAFVDDDGTAYISFWGLPKSDGTKQNYIRLARSTDVENHYEKWEKFSEPAVMSNDALGFTKNGSENPFDWRCCADPSNIWKKDGYYYMQAGNLCLIEQLLKNPDAPPELVGDWVDLLRSKDLQHWEFVHRFYTSRREWTAKKEDDMCPSFLPLPCSKDGGEFSGKYLQLFISHCRGTQYYIGTYDKQNDLFLPEIHSRMSFVDISYFAPEALIDANGRQIVWAWLCDNLNNSTDLDNFGWSGVYALPRTVWLSERGELGIAPVKELESLRYNETADLEKVSTVFGEISITLPFCDAEKFHLRLENTDDKDDYAEIYFCRSESSLVFDTTHCKANSLKARECAPFSLDDGEALNVRVFLDKAVVEVFANDRQAIARRIFIKRKKLCLDKSVKIKAWEIMPTNMF